MPALLGTLLLAAAAAAATTAGTLVAPDNNRGALGLKSLSQCEPFITFAFLDDWSTIIQQHLRLIHAGL